MRYINGYALRLMLLLAACLWLGCSDKSTEPKNPPPSTTMNHLWSNRFGDGGYQVAQAVAADTSGNVIIAGYFEGTVDFGGGALTSPINYDIFVVKFGADGTHLWSKRFGDGYKQHASAVGVDAAGNVIVTGSFGGTVDFGGGALTSAGHYDIFVTKFGSDGSHLWSKRFGDEDRQWVSASAVDASGSVIIVGQFGGAVDFGGGALTSMGSYDIFVVKFDSEGTHLWSRRFGDESNQEALAVAIDASENVIVSGHFQGTVDFGGGALTSVGDYDIFVATFDSEGTHLWSKRFGDGNNQLADGVAVDASAGVILAGRFGGTVDFGGGALTSMGSYDIFVVKFDSDGIHLWSRRFGDGNSQSPDAVAVDAFGNAIVTGSFWGAADFGGGALTSAGKNDIFIARLGSDGAHLWSKRFGGWDDQYARAIAVDAAGNMIVTGYFKGTVDFGGGALTGAGMDIFVAKFGR